ncbi:hypothetical protein GCM10010466_19940 [Planomonospora alba]|uniref:Uncharacterized protein n=1 Tax=Planomonospora alba TaxID=161354 RepID=A0ABP6MX72_9ACTN
MLGKERESYAIIRCRQDECGPFTGTGPRRAAPAATAAAPPAEVVGEGGGGWGMAEGLAPTALAALTARWSPARRAVGACVPSVAAASV